MGLACVPHSLFFGIPYTFVIRPPQIASFFSQCSLFFAGVSARASAACAAPLHYSRSSSWGPPPVAFLWLSIFIRIYGMEGIKRRLAEGVHLFDFIELDLT